jgi:tRNA(Ile2) C34 agmatinyltransferase TiaS
MQVMRSAAIGVSSELMSDILNCVCPDCGGSMGCAGRVFKCLGKCQRDWREIWERVLSSGFDRRSTRTIRVS